MFTSIRHIAVMTENWNREAKFYQTIFGMKKITNGMTDETGEYNKERGHLSDGVIGLALLQRQPGFKAGFDHFGFAVENVDLVRQRIKQSYPEIFIAESPGHASATVRSTTTNIRCRRDGSFRASASTRSGFPGSKTSTVK